MVIQHSITLLLEFIVDGLKTQPHVVVTSGF